MQWLTWIDSRGDFELEMEHSVQDDLTHEDHIRTTLHARQLEYGEKILLINMSRVVPEYKTAM
jgi:hypothetical protein